MLSQDRELRNRRWTLLLLTNFEGAQKLGLLSPSVVLFKKGVTKNNFWHTKCIENMLKASNQYYIRSLAVFYWAVPKMLFNVGTCV